MCDQKLVLKCTVNYGITFCNKYVEQIKCWFEPSTPTPFMLFLSAFVYKYIVVFLPSGGYQEFFESREGDANVEHQWRASHASLCIFSPVCQSDQSDNLARFRTWISYLNSPDYSNPPLFWISD